MNPVEKFIVINNGQSLKSENRMIKRKTGIQALVSIRVGHTGARGVVDGEEGRD